MRVGHFSGHDFPVREGDIPIVFPPDEQRSCLYSWEKGLQVFIDHPHEDAAHWSRVPVIGRSKNGIHLLQGGFLPPRDRD